MVKIFVFSYISSIQILISGYLVYIIFFKEKLDKNINIFEFGFYGTFLISFISLFFNFFISLSRIINDIIFILPLLIFFFYFNKNIFVKIVYYSIPIALLFTLTISFDTINRPDAGLYHLPYTSIINENKIILGINNLHFRFAHTSIIQYLSAVYNNHLFLDQGLLIPLGLIYCYSLGYFIFEILNKKYKNIVIIFFILFVFSIFLMNRYGGFGNDVPSHFLFFYLICESLKKNKISYKIKKSLFISTFIFLNKITLLLSFLIPIYFIIKNFKLNYIFNKVNILCFVFLSLFLFKNFLVSGCLIFPVEQTCVKKVFWYDSESKRNSNAKNAMLENESWAKGWSDQKGMQKSFEEYLSDYNWIYVWSEKHGKTIISKITPFLIFIFILIISLIIHQLINKNHKEKFEKYSFNDAYFVCFICICGCVLWFIKFPLFRYGYSYMAGGLSIILFTLFKNFLIFKNYEKMKRLLFNIVIVLLLAIVIKNIIRIYPNLETNNNTKYAWPNIYSENNDREKLENFSIYKNGEFLFYKSSYGTCHYSKSPCTHYFNNTDFTLDEINLKIIRNYKIFYFQRK